MSRILHLPGEYVGSRNMYHGITFMDRDVPPSKHQRTSKEAFLCDALRNHPELVPVLGTEAGAREPVPVSPLESGRCKCPTVPVLRYRYVSPPLGSRFTVVCKHYCKTEPGEGLEDRALERAGFAPALVNPQMLTKERMNHGRL